MKNRKISSVALIVFSSVIILLFAVIAQCEDTFKTVSASSDQKRPVVLVHGWGVNCLIHWSYITMELWRDGYDVYCHTFTSFLESIEKQACKLEEYVEQVLQDTGWDRVDLVGGSMGGLVVRYYLNFLGGTDKVEDVVMIASPNHGTWKALLIAPICQSGQDMVPNSPFLRQFRGEDETPGNEDGVLYMSLLAAVDQEINPDWSALLDGARNIRVWNCIGHQPMFFNETVYKLMVAGIEGGGWNNN